MKKQSKFTNRNTYDLSRNYGIGFTSKGQEFYFDLEDYQLVLQYIWYIDNHGYVRTNINENGKRTYLFMHHLVMGIMEKNILVDEGILPENWGAKEMGIVAKNLCGRVFEDCMKEEPETVSQIENFGKVANSICMSIARKFI